MHKGAVDKPNGEANEYLKHVILGSIVICSIIGALTALHFLLPKESKACALMPGFCKSNEQAEKRHFQQLGESYHAVPKFGLTTGRYDY